MGSEKLKETFLKLFYVMPIRNLNFGTSSYLKSTYEVAKNLTFGEKSYLLTGANDFNGTRWFNKEQMETTLWYILASVSMYSPRIMRENIYKLYRTLKMSQENANYKCADFIAVFQPVKKKTTTTRKSSTAKKSTASKTKKSEADLESSTQK